MIKEEFVSLDRLLAGSALALALWGILCVYSAGAGPLGRGGDLALRQAGWTLLGCGAAALVLDLGHQRLLDLAYPIYGLALALLALTPLLAPRVKGAQSWISLLGLRFQPSEFAKIALILMLSKFLSRHPPLSLRALLGALGAVSPAVLLLLLQPDAGSALVYALIALGMLLAAGAPLRYFGAMAGAGALLLPFAYMGLKDYQRMRLLVFLDPTRDPLGAGYNVIQSRIAVGSGGFLGKGFMQGMQSKLRFLPEPHTDFIFSVCSEEFGFLGDCVLLGLLAVVLCRVLAAGIRSRDRRDKALTAGVAAWLWFQSFESIGMSIGMMPITGLPLPLLSYGGSSLLATFIALGLVESVYVSAQRRPYF